MRFPGQIRLPDIDHPAIPAIFFVDDNHAEILLDEESLGRWSLYDVHARRLVSAAFEVDLGEEQITFLADDPIDFAYRGVEHMAKAWARFKAMQVPRRLFAVGRSRRDTQPSRIGELRALMEDNLRAASAATEVTDTTAAPAARAAPAKPETGPAPSLTPGIAGPGHAEPPPPDVERQRLELEAARSRLESERRRLEEERSEALQREE
ncbi:MAG: hypothetical protein ACRDVL_05405, partial [Acidimicrobiia bacterium]